MFLFLSGILIGIFSAILGFGGGIFIVPLLVYYKISIHKAIGTSVVCISFTSLSATVSYTYQKKIYYKKGIFIALFSTIGAWFGAQLTSLFSKKFLQGIFGCFLMFLSIKLFLLNQKRSTMYIPESKFKNFFIVGTLSFLAGVLAGFLGIGGGIIFVPLLTGFSLPIHNAVATSSFLVWITSVVGAFKHYLLKNVELKVLWFLVPGLIIGAQVGALLIKRISAKKLKYLLGVVLILISIKFIWKSIF